MKPNDYVLHRLDASEVASLPVADRDVIDDELLEKAFRDPIVPEPRGLALPRLHLAEDDVDHAHARLLMTRADAGLAEHVVRALEDPPAARVPPDDTVVLVDHGHLERQRLENRFGYPGELSAGRCEPPCFPSSRGRSERAPSGTTRGRLPRPRRRGR